MVGCIGNILHVFLLLNDTLITWCTQNTQILLDGERMEKKQMGEEEKKESGDGEGGKGK